MKKLMRKLVLSSFALGLAVITLSTTTFAWYTSNVQVKANNVSGASASSGSSLLMISNDDTEIENKQWDTVIDVKNYNKNGAIVDKPNELKPLHYSTDAKEAEGTEGNPDYVPAKEATTAIFANYGSTANQEDYIQFDLYFKMSGQATDTFLFITGLTLENTTEDTNTTQDGLQLPYKDVLMANDAWKYIDSTWGTTENPTKSTYNVDIRRALLISAVAKTMTGVTGTDVKETKVNLYNPDGLNAYADTLKDKTEGTHYNAHNYYNAIMCPTYGEASHTVGGTGCKCLKDVPASIAAAEYNATKLTVTDGKFNAVSVARIPASYTQETSLQHLKVTFTIFLNGWDYACFDACQGQKINLGLTFGVSTDEDTFTSIV